MLCSHKEGPSFEPSKFLGPGNKIKKNWDELQTNLNKPMLQQENGTRKCGTFTQ